MESPRRSPSRPLAPGPVMYTAVNIICLRQLNGVGPVAQSVQRLSQGLEGPGSNPGGGRDFPPVQSGPGAHPASFTMGTGSFPGVKCGRGVLLTTHLLLVLRSCKSRASRPGRSLPPGRTRCPLYRRLCGPQGRSGRVRKISSQLGFDPGPSSPQPFAIPTDLPGPQTSKGRV